MKPRQEVSDLAGRQGVGGVPVIEIDRERIYQGMDRLQVRITGHDLRV